MKLFWHWHEGLRLWFEGGKKSPWPSREVNEEFITLRSFTEEQVKVVQDQNNQNETNNAGSSPPIWPYEGWPILNSEFMNNLLVVPMDPIHRKMIVRLARQGVLPEGAQIPFGHPLRSKEAGQSYSSARDPDSPLGGPLPRPARDHQIDTVFNRGYVMVPTRVTKPFAFGKKSQNEMVGVLPVLVDVMTVALYLSSQDFMLFDGLRTQAEQASYVAAGTSKTMLSKHLKQPSGYGEAMDLVPVNSQGIPKWDWELIYPVVLAVDEAATLLGVADKIVWGGAWDRRLSDFGGSVEAYREECRAYANRHPGKDFLDGPHFEWRG